MGTHVGTFFVIWPHFAVPGGFGGQSDSQGLSQEPPGPVQASIFIDFGPILYLFFHSFSYHADYFWSSLSSYLLGCSISFIGLLQPLLYKFLATGLSFWGVVSGVVITLYSGACYPHVVARDAPELNLFGVVSRVESGYHWGLLFKFNPQERLRVQIL